MYQSVAEELSASRMVKGDLDESDPIAASVPLQYRNQKRWKDHVDTQVRLDLSFTFFFFTNLLIF